ncbi:Periplasmic component of the Tol biopolymer transport system [Gilliamella apis SCGC AB-598-P17]|nr:Periplasmic component of the Tol biopolymer transport system [Gilliamella apis SCGC AB-598-P17]KES15320.1 Periplasmic component of the Tol biopolymer transport system [Gilliamella apis SCGC AB-598-P17]KES15400.1 Periplasmic component of the Tol biopolymer transport system [Gilliamella apis SCGC AB-598-P17]
MIKFASRFLIACFGLLSTMMATAEVKIVITDGVSSAKPIAVVPFKWTGSGEPPQLVDNIVASDLRNSGKFNPIDVAAMPQKTNYSIRS